MRETAKIRGKETGQLKMAQPKQEGLLSREFTVLNVIFFFAAAVTALFFQFQHYLLSLPIPPSWFGFLIGADSLAAFVLQPILAVRLNGENGRRWIMISLFGMAVSLFAYNFALDLTSLAIVRIVHGAAFVCLVSAIMAMIVLYIPPEKSGRAFGLISVVRLLPYSIVPPLVGLAGDKPVDFRHLLILGGLMMLLTSVMAFMMRPVSGEGAAGLRDARRINAQDLFANLRDRKVAILLIVQLLLYSSYTIVFFFLKEFARGRGIENPGYFFTIATAAMIGVRLMGGAFFDRFNKAVVTGISLAGLAACYLSLGNTSRPETFYLLALFTGTGWGIVMPVVIALIFDVSAPHLRSMNLNLSLLMMQGGFFVGPFAGGLLVSRGSYGPLFVFTASMSVLAAGLVWSISGRKKP
jgi:predicted MFS family arabinose efflux permease